MNERIYLWSGTAPYSGESPEQAQPSLVPYPVPGSKGAVIVLAGGAYAFKTEYEMYPVAERINEAGVSAFVLDYRVCPCNKNAPLADANRAVRYVRSLGYEKVGILGFSAGGNLCCNAATHYDGGQTDSDDPIERFSSRPDGFFPCYAVVSCISYSHPWSVKNLLGKDYCDIPSLRYFSAELNVSPDTPPAFIWHTCTDNAVPVENSLNLALALSKNGVKYEMHIFPEGSHGLGLALENECVGRWSGELNKWLLREGYGA